MTTMVHLVLLVILLPAFSLAWVCYPPPHLLPDHLDCVALILGLAHISRLPADRDIKRWSPHLPTTEHTEQLPKWYYLVDEQQPPATCAIVVDADERDPSVVAMFRLRDVVDAAQVVYTQCLHNRQQVGLEFPSEEDGRVFAKIVRLDGLPPRLLRLGKEDMVKAGEVRKEVLPRGRGTIYIADAGFRRLSNVSAIS